MSIYRALKRNRTIYLTINEFIRFTAKLIYEQCLIEIVLRGVLIDAIYLLENNRILNDNRLNVRTFI